MAGKAQSGAELQDRLAQKTAEARILQQVSTELNATLNLEEIIEVVLRTMDELFGFRHSLLLLLEPSGDALTVVGGRGYDEPATGARVPLGTGLIGVVAKRRKLMRLSNLGQQRAYASRIRAEMEKAGRAAELGAIPKLPGLPNVESQIAIPLMVKDTLIGVFSVESEEQRTFTERDEALVTIVANQAAIAIHNARLYREEEERRRQLAEAHDRLKQLTETLEDRVKERTAELENAYRELRSTQAQLLQAAKMAALGDLVAGVAHEMNTPLGSLRASADVARRASEILAAALRGEADAGALARAPRLAGALEAVEKASETVSRATERIFETVRSLRQFARLDEAERKTASLEECLDITLTLLRHRVREGVEIVKDYGELPEIVCFPHRLNQVFMNLLVNALDAVGEKGRIAIRTRREGDEAIVEIADDGRGIPPEALHRIFDPAFTTRGTGVGMGLGLAISYRIVQEHGGTIEAASELGKGTVMTIRLPLPGT